jgi:hypothetical protein
LLLAAFQRPSHTDPYPTTPAMAAGIANHIWTIEEIVGLVDYAFLPNSLLIHAIDLARASAKGS